MMQSIFAGYFQHRLRPANVFPFISKIIKRFKQLTIRAGNCSESNRLTSQYSEFDTLYALNPGVYIYILQNNMATGGAG